jgi:tRNA-modifying protein YgfZ
MNLALPHLAALRVSGEGATAFLDAQFTRTVGDLASGELRLAAWCNPQGRVRALFRVLRGGDGSIVLVLPAELAGDTRNALARFILRAPVVIETLATPVIDASDLGPAELAQVLHGVHPRSPDRRLGVLLDTTLAARFQPTEPATAEDACAGWRRADILDRLPQVFAASSGLWLPQQLDLEALGGLSYTKGCYPGQEVVARLHYRGTLKQRLCLLEAALDAAATLPAPAAALIDDSGTRVAEVVDAASTASGTALALAVVDIAAEGAPLHGQSADGQGSRWKVVTTAA